MPGHLSSGKNVKKYLDRFNELVSNTKSKQYIEFGNGYLAGNNRNDYINYISQQSKVPEFYLRNYCIGLPNKLRNNHSKALFYFSWIENKDNIIKIKLESGKRLDESEVEEFLKSVTVQAIIVGSSNQSFRTYFSPIADKGETDVMLIKSDNGLECAINNEYDVIKDIIISNGLDVKAEIIANKHKDFFNSNLIAKSILRPEEYKSDEEFLNAIFKDCLTNEML